MKRRFLHAGRSLEVRAALTFHVWHLGVFEDGVPLSGDVARFSEKDIENARRKQGVDLVEETMLQVQRDVEKGKLPLPQMHRGWNLSAHTA